MAPSPHCLRHRARFAALAACLLSGCASLSPEAALDAPLRRAQAQHGATATLLRDPDAARAAADQARALLARGPLSADDAVRVAWLQNPALQARLATAWADQQNRAREAAPPDPRLAIERLARGDSVEWTRALTVPLSDWLLWPLRRAPAQAQQQALQLQAAQDLLADGFAIRAQWVQAVAAAQRADYLAMLADSADAGAELAWRLHAAGSFSLLQRSREESQAVQARLRLAQARQEAVAEREALVRALGLDGRDAATLQLPPQLPPVPQERRTWPEQVPADRLDLALARAEHDQAQAQQRLAGWQALDLEARLLRQREGVERAHGAELDMALPLSGRASAAGNEAQARLLAARSRWDAAQRQAASLWRERLATARSAQDLALVARDEAVPLAQRQSEQNLLRYNGMLIGPLELFADARLQAEAVLLALQTQRDHWLADNALQAAAAGASVAAPRPSALSPSGPSSAQGH